MENAEPLFHMACPCEFVEKPAVKHDVQTYEVEESLNSRPKIRRVEKGRRKGEDVYMALGRTSAGRYLAILFILKLNKEALILSARDMAAREKRIYAEK